MIPSRAGERVLTGLPELDTILSGGLVAHRPYLIVGPAGTGKTTLALQFLCEGARQGERCLLITLEEPPNETRINHPGLRPDLDRVYVFDAIPDVMRYEHTPFKDIAAVRQSVTFAEVPATIRKTPELSSVEVTFTALEQTIKMEVARRHYTRLVVDSLTALQYFCMKGFDEIVGAQTFLRFLSDLQITTLLTVEAPLEDVETPERLLARGEIRLFRWDLEGRTVRAIGVEKFRGSAHDVRLHPYRISPRGLDINLALTISRDTRQVVVEEALPIVVIPPVTVPPELSTDPLALMAADLSDLVALGVPLGDVRVTLLESSNAIAHDRMDEAVAAYQHARALVSERVAGIVHAAVSPPGDPARQETINQLAARATDARAGVPPVGARELVSSAERVRALVDRIQPPPPPPAVLPRPPEASVMPTLPPPPELSASIGPSVGATELDSHERVLTPAPAVPGPSAPRSGVLPPTGMGHGAPAPREPPPLPASAPQPTVFAPPRSLETGRTPSPEARKAPDPIVPARTTGRAAGTVPTPPPVARPSLPQAPQGPREAVVAHSPTTPTAPPTRGPVEDLGAPEPRNKRAGRAPTVAKRRRVPGSVTGVAASSPAVPRSTTPPLEKSESRPPRSRRRVARRRTSEEESEDATESPEAPESEDRSNAKPGSSAPAPDETRRGARA